MKLLKFPKGSMSIPVIKFMFKGDWKVLGEALNINPKYVSEDFVTANDLHSYLTGQAAGLVVCCMQEKSDLVQIASLIKLNKKLATTVASKIVVINFSGNKDFEKAIGKLGILDVVEPNINTKALRFKIDFWMKSINAQLKKIKPPETSQKAVKSVDAGKSEEKKGEDSSKPVWLDAMECQDDIWLTANNSDAKKVLTRWMVKLMGPSPYVGQWIDVPGKRSTWKFDLKPEAKEMLVEGTGTWIFTGDQKPDFIWKENLWLMTGTAFELFYEDGKTHSTRLQLKDKNFSITKNSMYAKTKEQVIIQSFDKEITFKKEHEEESKKSLENDNSLKTNLEGKGKTEQMEQNPLSGKGKTEQLEQNPLSGKGKTSKLNSDPLKMDLEPGSQLQNSDPLSQKADNSKISSFWDGKNSKDKNPNEMKGPANEGVREGAQLSQENSKNKHESHYKGHNPVEEMAAKEQKNNQYGKKTETESKDGNLSAPGAEKVREGAELGLENKTNQHQKHYKGHNPTEEMEGKDLKKNGVKTEAVKQGSQLGLDVENQKHETFYKGHNSTGNDAEGKEGKEKNATQLKAKDGSGKSKSSDSSETNEKKKGKSEESEDKKGMSGKSNTDVLPSHYGGAFEKKDDAKNSQEREKEERAKKDGTDKIASHMKSPDAKGKADEKESNKDGLGGSSSTDKISSHMQSPDKKGRSAEEKKSGEYGGTSSTDKLDSHYGSASKKGQAGQDEDGQEEESLEATWGAKKKKTPSGDSDSEADSGMEGVYGKSKNKGKDGPSAFDDEFYKKDSKDKFGKNKQDDSLFGSDDEESETNKDDEDHESEGAQVFSISKARQDIPNRVKNDEDTDLEELCRDAKVTSILSQGSNKFDCDLDDFFEETIIFCTDKDGIKVSNKVNLDLSFKFKARPTELGFEGNVLTVDSDDEGRKYITVEIDKKNVEEFSKFMELYQTRQENINLFLKKAKGL